MTREAWLLLSPLMCWVSNRIVWTLGAGILDHSHRILAVSDDVGSGPSQVCWLEFWLFHVSGQPHNMVADVQGQESKEGQPDVCAHLCAYGGRRMDAHIHRGWGQVEEIARHAPGSHTASLSPHLICWKKNWEILHIFMEKEGDAATFDRYILKPPHSLKQIIREDPGLGLNPRK